MEDTRDGSVWISLHDEDTAMQVRMRMILCPDPNCGKVTISAELGAGKTGIGNGRYFIPDTWRKIRGWTLEPESKAKTWPTYIPLHLREDYQEACLIASLSPKSSATLSRRVLHAMIADVWKVEKSNLADAIESLHDKIGEDMWQGIDAVRRLGNIGAHMRLTNGTIVNVDENEAEALIHLVETLFTEWYVERQQKAERIKKLTEMANAKVPSTKRQSPGG